MRAILISILLLCTLCLHGQYKIARKEKYLLLKEGNETRDTLYVTGPVFHYIIQPDRVELYRMYRLVIPDNCSTYTLNKEVYHYNQGEFIEDENADVGILFTSACHSYFHEEEVYCLAIREVNVSKNSLEVTLEDTEDNKKVFITSLDIFDQSEVFKKFQKEIDEFVKKENCISVRKRK